MTPRAILLDLDNTLTHRGRSITQYARRFQDDFGSVLGDIGPTAIAAKIKEVDRGGYGSKAGIFTHLLGHLPWRQQPALASIEDHWFSHFPSSVIPMQGLHTTLSYLRSQGIRLGIITNGSVRSQATKIQILDIAHYMTAIVISEAVNVKKPDATIFRHALREIGAEAQDTWFVGDHPINDVLGAAACGLTPVWVQGAHTWLREHPEPHRQIRFLHELIGFVEACP